MQELSLPVCLPPRTDPYELDPELDDDDPSLELSSLSDFLSRSSDQSLVVSEHQVGRYLRPQSWQLASCRILDTLDASPPEASWGAPSLAPT